MKDFMRDGLGAPKIVDRSTFRTRQADCPHPALGQDFTPSPTARRAQAGTGVRARSARKGARVDSSRGAIDNVDASPLAGIGVERLTLQPVLVRNDSILDSRPPA